MNHMLYDQFGNYSEDDDNEPEEYFDEVAADDRRYSDD